MNVFIINFYFLHKRKIITFIIATVLLVASFLILREGKEPISFVVAQRGDIFQEVSATGKVKPAQSVDLAFENGGKVSNVYIKVGEKVQKGQSLVRLESSDIIADYYKALASLESERAKLDQLKKGTRAEELFVYEAKVDSAKRSLEDANKNLLDKVNDAYVKSDDAIRNKVDQFISNPRGSNPQLNFTVDSKTKSDIEQGRVNIENILTTWKTSLVGLSANNNLSSISSVSKNNLNKVVSFLNEVAMVVNGLTATSDMSQTTISGYKTDISTARTNVNTAINNLSSIEETFRDAESALSVSERELDLAKAGSTNEQIRSGEAIVRSAEANVDAYKAQIAKRVIVSPINGVVTIQDAKVGEIIGANVKVVSIISGDKFEIEVNIPEADVSKVNINDKAEVTLDAYGDEYVFDAEVTSIDPAETVVEGVSVYKTKLRFIGEDGKIKSGMTANIDITTDKKEGVIKVIQRVIIGSNNERVVKILKDDGSIEERNIKVGIVDNDGNAEIIEGVSEGEKVVNPS